VLWVWDVPDLDSFIEKARHVSLDAVEHINSPVAALD
jgi:hypothetical protein